jgi:hypothetical protein
MVSYDTTQIAIFVSLVLAVAVIGTFLMLGVLAEALIRNRSARPARQQPRRQHYGRLAFHH